MWSANYKAHAVQNCKLKIPNEYYLYLKDTEQINGAVEWECEISYIWHKTKSKLKYIQHMDMSKINVKCLKQVTFRAVWWYNDTIWCQFDLLMVWYFTRAFQNKSELVLSSESNVCQPISTSIMNNTQALPLARLKQNIIAKLYEKNSKKL